MPHGNSGLPWLKILLKELSFIGVGLTTSHYDNMRGSNSKVKEDSNCVWIANPASGSRSKDTNKVAGQ